MVKLETTRGLSVWVNPRHVTLIWEHPVGEECTLALGEQMTDVKGTAEQVAHKLELD